jgi:c-di-GMP-related signal transduction protein
MTPPAEAAAMVKRYGPWRSRMLAEKVETREEFLEAKKAGFIYFQGCFSRRPELMQAREIPANRFNYLRMLQAVSQPELDPKEVEHVIKSEASICYRLLRYMNSAMFGFSTEIRSIKHRCRSSENGRYDAGFDWLQLWARRSRSRATWCFRH